jgi:hypothetical protein
MTHWAASLIGMPWVPPAHCWWVVCEFFRRRHDIVMPGHAAGVPALLEAARRSGWRRAEGPPQEDDIVMLSGAGGRHVGVMVVIDERLLLLHSNGHMTPRGPVGGVVLQSLQEAASGGYGDIELWRKS